MHFVSRKAGNIETFFYDLWDSTFRKSETKGRGTKFENFCKVNMHFNG